MKSHFRQTIRTITDLGDIETAFRFFTAHASFRKITSGDCRETHLLAHIDRFQRRTLSRTPSGLHFYENQNDTPRAWLFRDDIHLS